MDAFDKHSFKRLIESTKKLRGWIGEFIVEIKLVQQSENDTRLIELNWAEEAESRIDAYRAGILECLPIEEVLAEIGL